MRNNVRAIVEQGADASQIVDQLVSESLELFDSAYLNFARTGEMGMGTKEDGLPSMEEALIDEGVLDVLKKGVEKVKELGQKAKDWVKENAQKVADWVGEKILKPLQDHLKKLVPGFSWGKFEKNGEGLIEAVLEILSKNKKLADESMDESLKLETSWLMSDRDLIRTGRVTEAQMAAFNEMVHGGGIERAMNEGRTRLTVDEAGAIGAVFSAIHWTHFGVEVLEGILNVAPSIPLLAEIIGKLKAIENNPKLKKYADFYEKHKMVIDSVCITIGFIEVFLLGAGPIVLVTTLISTGVFAKHLWKLYIKHDKEAAKVATAKAESLETISEASAPPPGTLYVDRSTIFDNPRTQYKGQYYATLLKKAGAKKVRLAKLFGWSNQPQVVLFTGISAKQAEAALAEAPEFQKYGPMIRDAHQDWTNSKNESLSEGAAQHLASYEFANLVAAKLLQGLRVYGLRSNYEIALHVGPTKVLPLSKTGTGVSALQKKMYNVGVSRDFSGVHGDFPAYIWYFRAYPKSGDVSDNPVTFAIAIDQGIEEGSEFGYEVCVAFVSKYFATRPMPMPDRYFFQNTYTNPALKWLTNNFGARIGEEMPTEYNLRNSEVKEQATTGAVSKKKVGLGKGGLFQGIYEGPDGLLCTWQAEVWGKPSPYGINNGRVSKLWISYVVGMSDEQTASMQDYADVQLARKSDPGIKFVAAAEYDRGWVKKPRKGTDPYACAKYVLSMFPGAVEPERDNILEATDDHAMRELQLYIENDETLYRTRVQPFLKNLKAKIKRGVYDPELAVKLWEYLVVDGIKQYQKEFGPSALPKFSPADRKEVARNLAASFEEELRFEEAYQGKSLYGSKVVPLSSLQKGQVFYFPTNAKKQPCRVENPKTGQYSIFGDMTSMSAKKVKPSTPVIPMTPAEQKAYFSKMKAESRKRMGESLSPQDSETIKNILRSGKALVDLRGDFEAAGYTVKVHRGDPPMPPIYLALTRKGLAKEILVVNKRYADGDLVVGDIAVGILESRKNEAMATSPSPAEKVLAKKMKAKGLNYVLVLPKELGEPIYFKTVAEIGPFVREMYPNLKPINAKKIDDYLAESKSPSVKKQIKSFLETKWSGKTEKEFVTALRQPKVWKKIVSANEESVRKFFKQAVKENLESLNKTSPSFKKSINRLLQA